MFKDGWDKMSGVRTVKLVFPESYVMSPSEW